MGYETTVAPKLWVHLVDDRRDEERSGRHTSTRTGHGSDGFAGHSSLGITALGYIARTYRPESLLRWTCANVLSAALLNRYWNS